MNHSYRTMAWTTRLHPQPGGAWGKERTVYPERSRMLAQPGAKINLFDDFGSNLTHQTHEFRLRRDGGVARRGNGTTISARIRPGRGDMTRMRSDKSSASVMLCVTMTTVGRRRLQMRRSSVFIRSRVRASSEPNGSSSRSSSGSWISAWASATRCARKAGWGTHLRSPPAPPARRSEAARASASSRGVIDLQW